jgi:hypothetical protein
MARHASRREGLDDQHASVNPHPPRCDSLFVSTNGGTNWNKVQSINPPTNIPIESGPDDTTLAYGANHLLTGSFLTLVRPPGLDIFTGNAMAPGNIASFNWNMIDGGVVEVARVGPAGNNCSGTSVDRFRSAQRTDQINTHGVDQPWVAVHSYVPDPVATEARSNAPFPNRNRMQNDVYVAYGDFSRPDVPVRVAVSVGANPPNFTIDQQVGTKGSGGCVNPGHRLAVAPQTIDNNGDLVGRGFVYSLHQRCADSSANPPKLDIVLNRTTDHGATWSLNGNPEGIVVAQVSSQQPTPKFGTVNGLFGGIDQIAVDPSNGMVYVVYGVFDETIQGNRIAMRRLFYEKCNEFSACDVLVVGPEIFVDDGQSPAALPAVAVAANGTVGVLYDTFDGMISGLPVFVTHLGITDGRHGSSDFNIQSLMVFLSPAPEDHVVGPKQRVLGDFQQMVAVGNKFYGVFSGNGAALGRSMATIDPIVFIADVSNATPITTSRNTSRTHKQLRR